MCQRQLFMDLEFLKVNLQTFYNKIRKLIYYIILILIYINFETPLIDGSLQLALENFIRFIFTLSVILLETFDFVKFM